MAEQHPTSDDHSAGGTMDITDHVKMWNAFWNTSKWGVVGVIILAILLFTFRTHNG
ncbi:MAG TPA: aa3-type cytochrome c oxidase subunit IV [Micropepsaceae bacterium]|jgi:hypothetical protein